MSRKYLKHAFIGVTILVIASLTVAILPGKTTASAAPCILGKCPKELTSKENNGVFTYRIRQRFNVRLDTFTYPPELLRCAPNDIVSETASLADLYPNHVKRFEAAAAGQCTMQNGDYTVTIIVVDPNATTTPLNLTL